MAPPVGPGPDTTPAPGGVSPEIERLLLACGSLPSLSAVALQVLELAREPDVHLRDLTDVLSRDPALAAKVLRMANSPLYGRRRAAQNLRQALSVLGLNATITLALSFSLAAGQAGDQAGPGMGYYWRRAVVAALAARLLGKRVGLESLEELFLAGLLQDLGMLAMDAVYPGRYFPLLEGLEDHHELLGRERQAFGTDHAAVGAWLMQRWGLPDYLPLAVTASHQPEPGGLPVDLQRFLGCVAVAAAVAEIYAGDDSTAATRRAAEAARDWLGLEQEQLSQVLEEVAATLPDMETLFDVQLLAPGQIQGITAQAQELLALRQLLLIQQVDEHSARTEQLEQANRRLREAGRRDVLTGLYNRGHLDEVLEVEFDQASRQGWPLTLGFVDLDHFKSVNDRYGHVAGDRVLARMAEVLGSQLRAGDLAVRYGGEEFVVLLPGVSGATAAGVFERVRRALERAVPTLDDGTAVAVTASIGVASHMDGALRRACPQELVQAADAALYAAKRAGRNRVARAED